MKKCSKCKKQKTEIEFVKNKSHKDGMHNECKICTKERERIRIYRNTEKDRERLRRYYKNNKNPDKARETSKNWRKNNLQKALESERRRRRNNPDRARENCRNWYKNNTERARANFKRWYNDNPDQIRVRNNRRRTLKSGNGGSFTIDEWQDLCTKYENKCLRCGEQKKLTADHVVPVAKGGTSNIDNIQPLCKSCNSSKATKIIDYR